MSDNINSARFIACFASRQCAESGGERRFLVQWQTLLPGNDELRGSEVLPDAVRRRFAGWGQGRRTV